jgi:hypothetical protein
MDDSSYFLPVPLFCSSLHIYDSYDNAALKRTQNNLMTSNFTVKVVNLENKIKI